MVKGMIWLNSPSVCVHRAISLMFKISLVVASQSFVVGSCAVSTMRRSFEPARPWEDLFMPQAAAPPPCEASAPSIIHPEVRTSSSRPNTSTSAKKSQDATLRLQRGPLVVSCYTSVKGEVLSHH
eukprot:6317898-Amphidinium_carterae.1